MEETRAAYLGLLSELYPTIAEAATEIVNLSSSKVVAVGYVTVAASDIGT